MFPLTGWVPVRGFVRDGEPWAEWIYAGEHRFSEPFFRESVDDARQTYGGTEFERMAPLQECMTVRRPAGLIFHMSRCGSTLISRSLAAADSVRVISEAAPVDDMAQTGRADWLAWMASALAGKERHLVFKMDAWHIRSLPVFRQAFPDTPWIFVFREPREVLVSQLRQPGIPALGGAIDPALLGMAFEDVVGLNRPRWTTRVLGNLMRSALEFRDDSFGMFVDYEELPDAILGKIAGHFRLDLTPPEEAAVRAARQSDAKAPGLLFQPDRESKQKEAEALEADPCLAMVQELYRELLHHKSCSRILRR